LKLKVSNTGDNAGITQSQACDMTLGIVDSSNVGTKQLVSHEISKQLCHRLSMPVVNALFQPTLQCVSRYTATLLVYMGSHSVICLLAEV